MVLGHTGCVGIIFWFMLCVYGFGHGFDMVLAVLNAGCMYVLVYVAV